MSPPSPPISPRYKLAVLAIVSALAIVAVVVIAFLVYTGVADERISIVTGFTALALIPIITTVLQVVNHSSTTSQLTTVQQQTNGLLSARLDATAQQAAQQVIDYLETQNAPAPEHMVE